MKKVILLLVALGALAVGWFFVSPLFIDEAVDEGLSFQKADGSFDMSVVESMSETDKVAAKDDIMSAAAAAPDKSMDESMGGEAAVLARGQFVDADEIHKGEGDAILYAAPDGRHLVRFENFRTTNGPALVVYLANHSNPTTAADVTDGGFFELGELKGNVGNQNYWLPEGMDATSYGSVVIWCELFGVLFSPAALSAVVAEQT